MPFSVFFRNPLIQLALWKIRKKHESQPYLLITLFKPTRILYHCENHEIVIVAGIPSKFINTE